MSLDGFMHIVHFLHQAECRSHSRYLKSELGNLESHALAAMAIMLMFVFVSHNTLKV